MSSNGNGNGNGVDWRFINLIGKSYLDVLQNKVSCGHRLDKLEFQELDNLGYVEVTKRNEQGDMKAWKVKEGFEEKAEKALEELKQTRGWEIMKKHKRALEQEQKRLVDDAMEIIGQTALWEFCSRVKGLGPVAALTFLAYINPKKCPSAGRFWAYVGLAPNKKLKKGQRGSFNPEIKGRLVFCCANTIMHTDPYYYPIYKAKKEYYALRYDTTKMKQDKVKGVQARVNTRAKMVLTKLIISHAIEIIRTSNGMSFPRHRNHIPPKPVSEEEQKEIIERYVKQQAWCNEEIAKRMAEGMSFEEAKDRLDFPVYD